MNLTTEVVRCEQRILTAPKPKKGAPVEAPPMPEWEVELNDTVLFPEGGGQPSDQGTIEVIDSPSGKTGSVNVREVLRRNLDAVHFVDEPLIVGSKVSGAAWFATLSLPDHPFSLSPGPGFGQPARTSR